MNTLAARILALKPLHANVVTCKDRTSIRRLAETTFRGDSPLPETVVIDIASPSRLLSALCALDGKVENLALVSAGTSDMEINRRFASFSNFLLISDRPKLENAIALEDALVKYKPLANRRSRWLLSTSGTTSRPKLVAHTFTSLVRTAKTGDGSSFVWGQMYDPCRFAGLQVALQALLGGSSLIVPDPEAPLLNRIELLIRENVNVLSATPTLWRKILMTKASTRLNLRSVTIGGEIADARILQALAERFPSARIRHIYASTEAGTGFSVSDGQPGFPTEFLESGWSGIRMQVKNGELMIRNNYVEKQYVGGSSVFADESGFVFTGDLVEIRDKRVFFVGRKSGQINVGGNKVFPERVESALLDVPGVELLRAHAVNNPIIGQLVGLDVVLGRGYEVDRVSADLRSAARENLTKYERPARYRFVDEINHSCNGKVIRQ